MHNLILLTNGYPYGTWETYLETEVQYYSNYFENVYICSLQVRKEHKEMKRLLPCEEFRNCRIDYKPRYVYLLNSFRAFSDINYYKEIVSLIKRKQFSIGKLVRLTVFLTRAHYEARKILCFLAENGIGNSGLIYSYRFEYQPYVGMLIQRKYPEYKVIARGHGADLFEWRNKDSYIPLREEILAHIDKVYLIAEDGRKYLEQRYPKYTGKLEVSRLGTEDYGYPQIRRKQGSISVVSCSAVVAVKRIDLIIKAMSKITDIDVYWTHFGEGPLLGEFQSQCVQILPENIHFDFKGFIPNQDVLKEYQSGRYHLFLNVSSSEGVPVSIMEVMSFGIPCIATDVGGTGEIITDGKDGILLRPNFDCNELVELIHRFADMDEEEYQIYRKNARNTWHEKYSAERNYNEFCREITGI